MTLSDLSVPLLCCCVGYILRRLCGLESRVRLVELTRPPSSRAARASAWLADWRHPLYRHVHMFDEHGDLNIGVISPNGTLVTQEIEGPDVDRSAAEFAIRVLVARLDNHMQGRRADAATMQPSIN